MRPSIAVPAAPALPGQAPPPAVGFAPVRKLLPYVWQWKWRVLFALACLIGAKLANIGVPLVLKSLVDALDLKPGVPRALLV